MRHGRLLVSSLLAIAVWTAWSGMMGTASAAPPKIGKSSKSSWTEKLWPSRVAAPSEPTFLKTTRAGMARTWNGMQRTTRSAWEKTKYVLRPYDPPTKKQKYQAQRNDGGFWSNLFGGSDTRDSHVTVNEFLRQPSP